MRLALADAGDTLEDANFVEKMADAGILRLYTFHEWIREMIASKDQLRTGPKTSYEDRVFESEINQAIRQTELNYEQMTYRDAVKTGFYELQASRDKYREMCLNGMHRDLVFRFIEVQTLLLSPICPHLCEDIWKVIGKSGSILNADWPVAGDVDETLLKSAVYLTSSTHEFRLRIKNLLAPKGKKQKDAPPPAKPTHGLVYVASSFPPWQHVTLTTLKQLYHSNGGAFPDNRIIMNSLKDAAEVKKYMKKLMPFVQYVRSNVERDGPSAMDTTVPFNELEVLRENEGYLKKALDLVHLEIKPSSEGDAKVQEECAPGKPFTVFSAQSMVSDTNTRP
ncbi:predicted protein, partial [Nematostella vectensis]